MTVSGRMFDDGDDLRNLQIDLEGAPLRVQFGASRTMRRAAKLVNVQMTKDAAGHLGNWFGRPGTSYVTPLPEHVSDEMIGDLEAEVGIEAKGAGKLGRIIALGSVNNPPAYDPYAALRRSTPEVLEMFADTAEESVLGGEK